MNSLDNKIIELLLYNSKIPDNYNDKIYEILESLPRKKSSENKIKNIQMKLAIMFCCSVILISGIVLGKQINIFFQGLLNNNDGIISALENNYVENARSEYSKSNDIKSYIDSILMDDYKLCVSLSFELPSNYEDKNINKIYIPNIIMYDENENILFNYFDDEIDFDFYNIQGISENNRYWNGSFDIGDTEKEGNIYSFSYIINSNKFPKSKIINIKFDKIVLQDTTLMMDETKALGFDGVINKSTIDEINGKWNLKYDLSKITYERENEIYKIKNYNDYNFNFPEEIVVSNTETRFKFSYELNNISKGDSISINKESYIKTKNDVIFTSNKNYEYIEHIVQCELTFELSTFNSTSTMQLIIPTESGNDIILELVKKEQEK